MKSKEKPLTKPNAQTLFDASRVLCTLLALTRTRASYIHHLPFANSR